VAELSGGKATAGVAMANDVATVEAMQADRELREVRDKLLAAYVKYRYTYNFTWFGRPIIQLPEDIVAIQEIILSTRPDLIIETGVAHGGSIALSASMLELLGAGEVVGIDVDIRQHNREALEAHPMRKRIRLIQGSSTEDRVLREVRARTASAKRVMVILDSNHTHAHVAKELELYSPLVTRDCYLVVFDTVVEDLPDGLFPDRPWGKGNNPKTAVWDFLQSTDRFEIDRGFERRLFATVAPDGYLRCIKD
jgi:cephalosporin hydroxylase